MRNDGDGSFILSFNHYLPLIPSSDNSEDEQKVGAVSTNVSGVGNLCKVLWGKDCPIWGILVLQFIQ